MNIQTTNRQTVSVQQFITKLETNLYGDYAMHEITKRELKIFQDIINYTKEQCNINE